MEEFTIEVIKAFESRVIANQDISVKQFKSKENHKILIKHFTFGHK